MRFLLLTFGCKTNQYESQGVRELLAASGFAEAFRPEEADLLIVNTCGVTGRAGASCRNAIRKNLRANPALRVVVTGCGVDLGEQWPDEAGPAPLLVANAQKHALPRLLGDWLAARPAASPAGGDRFGLSVSAFHGHTRAFIKIQDGCDNHCAYCAVPRARGEPISRPAAAVLEEAARLAANGYGELVLTGINIGVYRDGAVDFPALVAKLVATPGLVRLRLGSVEPPQLTERLVDVMAGGETICPHVHLPLQSGDDGVLAAMRRRYTVREFAAKAEMLRRRLDRPAITTDVIVGFPGEDEKAFRNTFGLCENVGFSRLHVFLFSPRPGTPAAAMGGRSPDRLVEGRKTELLELGQALAERFAAGCVGLEERVIVERSAKGAAGLGDRYVRVGVPGGDFACGEVVRVRVTAATGAELVGEALRPDAACFDAADG